MRALLDVNVIIALLDADHVLEVPGQADRRLPVPGAEVNGEIASGADVGEPGEQLGRIRRPEAGVICRVAREQVLERHRQAVGSRRRLVRDGKPHVTD